ncbi:MAG: D-2-hydroxyacid dehydrogenase [Campylobacterales bacterium]|nr:D-2-hydroxyacid dehydrogenase [Campylobacterales bacterium]
MKIVLLDAKTLGVDIDIEPIKTFGTLTIFETTNENQTLDRIKDADIIITNKVVIDKEFMAQSKNLKLICVAATGMNNIDLNAAKELGIKVKNVSGYSTYSVVQHTFAIAFYLLEQLSYYDDAVKSKKWSASNLFTDLTHSFSEIRGKKWGIIGLGSIGKEVAKIASAFGSDVSYYSTSGTKHCSDYTHLELDELLSNCDIISIHSPLNENTVNLINSSNLPLLKDGALLLNLGRGGIINEDDLANAIDSQNIFAGLDVTKIEPIEHDNPLLNIKNKNKLFITPHIAWASREARVKLVEGIVENIEEFLQRG